jgi:hypothetical protein
MFKYQNFQVLILDVCNVILDIYIGIGFALAGIGAQLLEGKKLRTFIGRGIHAKYDWINWWFSSINLVNDEGDEPISSWAALCIVCSYLQWLAAFSTASRGR